MSKQTRQPDRSGTPPRRGRSRVRVLARADEGASAVEFALVSTLVFLLLFGLINFGIIFSQQLTLNNAVREGARKAVVNELNDNRTCQGIVLAARNELSGLAMDPEQVQFRISQEGFSNSNGCGTGFVTNYPNNNGQIGKSVPCTGSRTTTSTTSTAGSLVVEAKYTTSALIAFPPFDNSFTITSKAVFRCEFDA